jgi:hypothetical protein
MLFDMGGAMADGWSGGGGAADIIGPLAVLDEVVEAMLDLVPGALVLRLLLTPDDLLDVRIGFERAREGVLGKG